MYSDRETETGREKPVRKQGMEKEKIFMERKEKQRTNMSVQGEVMTVKIKKETAKKPKLRKRPMKRRTAVMLAAAVVLQGIFAPADMALAYGRSGEEAECEVRFEGEPDGLEMSAQDGASGAAACGDGGKRGICGICGRNRGASCAAACGDGGKRGI